MWVAGTQSVAPLPAADTQGAQYRKMELGVVRTGAQSLQHGKKATELYC